MGATGPTGPTGAIGEVLGPEYTVTAALNIPTTPATPSPFTIPFGFIVSGNVGGIFALNPSTGVFTVPKSGTYRVDFNVQFTASTAALAGTGITVNVNKFNSILSSTAFQFPYLTTAACTNSVNGYWSGSFLAGDLISVQVANNLTVPFTVNGTAIPGVSPYNTIMTVSSDF